MSKLLNRAKVKLENATNDYNKLSVDDAYIDDCCYNLQQAIEFTLKFLVELTGQSYVENHDIRAQLNKLKGTEINIPCKEELRMLASTVNEWENSSRYKDDFCAVKEDIDAALKCADSLVEYAAQYYRECNSSDRANRQKK